MSYQTLSGNYGEIFNIDYFIFISVDNFQLKYVRILLHLLVKYLKFISILDTLSSSSGPRLVFLYQKLFCFCRLVFSIAFKFYLHCIVIMNFKNGYCNSLGKNILYKSLLTTWMIFF